MNALRMRFTIALRQKIRHAENCKRRDQSRNFNAKRIGWRNTPERCNENYSIRNCLCSLISRSDPARLLHREPGQRRQHQHDHCAQGRLQRSVKARIIIATVAVAASLLWCGYIGSQQPHCWCNREWAGISLSKGGYRSWSMRFCDGMQSLPSGKMQPVVILPGGRIRNGYYRWPRFHHADVRKMIFWGHDTGTWSTPTNSAVP